MASSTSLYRKYRSQTFDELVGQEPVVRTLKNSIASNRISHAYLFTGPRGVGKTSAARLLARAANCLSEGGDKPCNECANCLSATRDIATDLIEIDAASNTGVDNIREVIEKANFSPSVWNTKFYIIDEVHMLSTSAFNALLKTLEEPPAHTSFVLATTEVHKVPATVASRCQRFDFRRVPLQAMVDRLAFICKEEGIDAEPAALELVSRQATGSLRDAESLLDQLRVYAEKTITLASVQEMLGAGGSEEVATFVDTLIAADTAEGLRRIARVLDDGRDLRQFNRQVVEHMRDLMLVKSGAAASGATLLDVTEEMRARLHKQAERVTLPELLRWTRIFSEADSALRATIYGQLPLEMAFISATLAPQEGTATPVRDRSADIESAVEQVGSLPRQRPGQHQPAQRQPQPTGAPPPIYSDMQKPAGNGIAEPVQGNGASAGRPAPAPADKYDEESEPIPLAHLDAQPVEEVTKLEEEITAPRVAGDDAGELEKLRSLWDNLADQINARSKSMGVVFANTEMVRPIKVSGGVVTISFRHPIQAKRSMTSSPSAPYRDIIEGALSRVLGYRCLIECITFDQEQRGDFGGDSEAPGKPTAKPNGQAAPKKPSPYETTRGKAAINIFGIEKFDDSE